MQGMQKLTAVFLLLSVVACSGEENLCNGNSVNVAVSIVPQKYFVEKIAGDLARITVLIPPGANPESYELSPSDMRAVSEADVWFTIGLQRESIWLSDFASVNEQIKIISTIESIQRLPIGRYGIPEEHFQESDDGSHQHDPGEIDPHVWLSPELVREQAAVICESLCEIDPENSGVYTDNLTLFLQEIDDLQNTIHTLLDPCAGEEFIVFHPAWGYFADEFNLWQIPIEISGSEPSPGEMSRLIDFGRSNTVKVVFVSPQFSQSSALTIASELTANVTAIDPLAESWDSNLRFVAEELARAME
jgi:zinc transport system substrate-binding protein